MHRRVLESYVAAEAPEAQEERAGTGNRPQRPQRKARKTASDANTFNPIKPGIINLKAQSPEIQDREEPLKLINPVPQILHPKLSHGVRVGGPVSPCAARKSVLSRMYQACHFLGLGLRVFIFCFKVLGVKG